MSVAAQIKKKLELWLVNECGVVAAVGVDVHRLSLDETSRPRTIEMEIMATITMALMDYDTRVDSGRSGGTD